ncbi:MAG: DUF2130 domain-containing protein [Microgenomates group bacterium]
MNDTIICPHCKKPIPLTQALSHQIQEKYQKFYRQRLEEEKQKIASELKIQLTKKVKEEMELQLKDKINETEELRKQNQGLKEQLLELNRLIRQLRKENEEKQIELEKRLAQEEEKIRQEAQRRLDEEYKLKLLEKDKKLNDALKLVEEYKRKLEQGSQQLQGEVQELELESVLKKEFPNDEVKEVPKGVTGADVLQVVKNNYGKACGTIIWESKRTKAWSDNWIAKLKEDQRRVKAEVAVIISQVLPNGVKNFTFKNGVWIGSFEAVVGLALALRNSLIEIYQIKSSISGKEEKKEILWNYLTSIEFRQRIEAVYDAYSSLMEDLRKEKDYFRKKWAKQEKNIEKVAENILGIHGDLQGIVGKSLPEIKAMEALPEPKDGEKGLF